jgi:hypothetical protein
MFKAHCQSRTHQLCNQNFVKELASLYPEKKNKKFPYASQKLNLPTRSPPNEH